MITSKTSPAVLLIEDDDVDAMAVSRALAKNKPDIRVFRAVDGLDGLAALRKLSKEDEGPLLVLLDLNMPKMSGIEFLMSMRKEEPISSTVTFVLTTSNDERDIAAAYGHHVAGYLQKSMTSQSMNELAELLDEYFKRITFPRLID